MNSGENIVNNPTVITVRIERRYTIPPPRSSAGKRVNKSPVVRAFGLNLVGDQSGKTVKKGAKR